MDEHEIREALNRHWAASDANDFDVEHDIYQDDAVLEYPQSGERIRGRHNIQASRVAQPNAKRFKVRRIIGRSDLWVTEFILTYDGQPSYSVSIMEFVDGRVARETQYFGDPFEPGPSRANGMTSPRQYRARASSIRWTCPSFLSSAIDFLFGQRGGDETAVYCQKIVIGQQMYTSCLLNQRTKAMIGYDLPNRREVWAYWSPFATDD
jgi:hypothetical protein